MLTILMATHNGASTLPSVLDSYLQLAPPTGGWCLVVIDNASTDDTSKIIKSFTNKLPLLPLFTERRGKNVALNIGLRHIEGDLVVFTDDDTIPNRDWLTILRQSALEQPDYDIFGGQIEPIWPGELPAWIPRLVNLGATFAITPQGIATGPVSAAQIWGSNMVVRQHIFADGHRFHEGVGPQDGEYIMGSEVEFTRRIERLGYKAWFIANARVGHMIRPYQMDPKWIIQRAYRLGRHMFHQEKDSFTTTIKLIRGAPRWQYRRLISAYANSIAGVILRNSDRKFTADWSISFLRGYLAEANKNISTLS